MVAEDMPKVAEGPNVRECENIFIPPKPLLFAKQTITSAMEALSSSVILPPFQQTHYPKRQAYLRTNFPLPKTTHLAAAARQASGDADDDQQQQHLHNVFDFAPQELESSYSGDSGQIRSNKDINTDTHEVRPTGGSRAGLFRTPISGGVQSATSVNDLPKPALAVRNLMEQARSAHLCTVMSPMHQQNEGYPFGSLVDFAPDAMGHPIFSFSQLGIHTRNLLADPRCTLVVQIPGWSGLSNARVTIFGDVFPLPEGHHQEWAHKQYIAKHPQAPSQQWGNFYYFRMQNISDIYFIGGFGTVAWVNVKEYESLQPDEIAVNGSEQNMKELNMMFSKPLKELFSLESEVDDASLISVDSKGADIRVRNGAEFNIQRLVFEEWDGIKTVEEAKSALWNLVNRGGAYKAEEQRNASPPHQNSRTPFLASPCIDGHRPPAMDAPPRPGQRQPQHSQQPPEKVTERLRLNPAVQQQLNLESVNTRAISLFKSISRILEDLDLIARTNSVLDWHDVVGSFSMVDLELYRIVEDIKKVSKAFVVHPKNVSAENAAILPVMISSKLLPEIEADENSKREQLLYAMQNLPVPSQIEKLKARIDMIGAACESAEKVIADTRKTYFGTRQGPAKISTLDKAQAAKIREQENLLRRAVNHGQGLRLPMDQRQIASAFPAHLADVYPVGENVHTISESSEIYMKNTPPVPSNTVKDQGALMQGSGSHNLGGAAASPGGTGTSSFDNTTASLLPYANMMNTPSPQQQTQQQQRPKVMRLPQHQQFRQSPMTGLGQQFSQSLGPQQFQGRQLNSGGIQHGIAQSQRNQANQLNRHLNQMSGTANSTLFNAAQATSNNQMMPNMPAMMSSQTLANRMQLGLSGGNRTLGSQSLNDQANPMQQ
ncbi:hypothetical protein SSX86_002476 [Deinandra increscens subsp. villosa]|uniref:CREG-like beta-barrel domain-containing protein n=1 Tax=Deinandra increscens subsp. villosa TaxID=3103831 RepID=A0AAP0H9M2_9ASTR